MADENVNPAWWDALADAGFDIRGVKSVGDRPTVASVTEGADDVDVLTTAIGTGRALLTGDVADFSDPPRDDHPGIVIVPNDTQDPADVCRAVERIATQYETLSGRVEFVTDWV